MKSSLALASFLLLAGSLKSAADAVELNGLINLFGDKLAFLVLYQPAQTKPITFTLAEGESQFGIRLIEVDAAGGRVQIEQCGMKKFLRMSSAPELTRAVSESAVTENHRPTSPDPKAIASFLASEEAQRIQAGQPGVSGASLGGGLNLSAPPNAKPAADGGAKSEAPNHASNAKDSTAASGPNSRSGQTDSSNSHVANVADTAKNLSPANGQNDPAHETWYQESLTIEQNRIATANEVLAGEATPWPRTPLTPATTPAMLIGKETFFSNHIANYVVPGYLNPLADAR